jgi:hypothetical protein
MEHGMDQAGMQVIVIVASFQVEKLRCDLEAGI